MADGGRNLKVWCLSLALTLLLTAPPGRAEEVVVLVGPNQFIDWLESENWWGEGQRGTQLTSPHALITGISSAWQKNASALPVPDKKEIFYRLLTPLALHANAIVLDRRNRLKSMAEKSAEGESLNAEEIAMLRRLAVILRIHTAEDAEGLGANGPVEADLFEQLLYRMDVVPAGLVLGQGAYESGYGTSRFAIRGNALFGQWDFSGQGLIPEQQRKEHGDHRIAAFDWPFDSVRGYFINLNSHPAYEPFRKLRADLRARGEPLTALALADGLINYSERGQEYVDTLKGIIRVNKLERADDAALRDEPLRFLVGVETEAEAVSMREEIAQMRKTGELMDVISRMQLE